jgi:hypothetical protein
VILKESFENPLQRILPLAYEAITNHEARAVLKDWMIEHVPAHFDATVWAGGAVGWLLWRREAHDELLYVIRMSAVYREAIGENEKRHTAGTLWVLYGDVPPLASPDVFTARDLAHGFQVTSIEPGKPVFGIDLLL